MHHDIPIEQIELDSTLACSLADDFIFVSSDMGINERFLDSHNGEVLWRTVRTLSQSEQALDNWVKTPNIITEGRLNACAGALAHWLISAYPKTLSIAALLKPEILLANSGSVLKKLINKHGYDRAILTAITNPDAYNDKNIDGLMATIKLDDILRKEWLNNSVSDLNTICELTDTILNDNVKKWLKDKTIRPHTQNNESVSNQPLIRKTIELIYKMSYELASHMLPFDFSLANESWLVLEYIEDVMMVYAAGLDDNAPYSDACIIETILSAHRAEDSTYLNHLLDHHNGKLHKKIIKNPSLLDELIENANFPRLKSSPLILKIQSSIVLAETSIKTNEDLIERSFVY